MPVRSKAVLAPGCDSAGVADLEHGGSFALVHFAGESLIVGAGGGGDDGHGNAGLLGVGLCESLPGFIGFGLEVEVVDEPAAAGSSAALAR